jgi:hypothetical protein
MKYKQNRHIAKLIFMTIIAFALSGGCFFVGMNWSTWFPSVAEVPVNPDPMVQDPNTDGGNPKSIAETNKYTDFTYRGKVYRVEKSLLTEAGSQYSASNRYYRFVNNKWEVREARPNSNWKPAPKDDISVILSAWNKKFKDTVIPENPPVVIPPPIGTPPPSGTPPKAVTPTLPGNPPTPGNPRTETYDEVLYAVKLGECNAECIRSKKGLSETQKRKLMSYLH